MGTHLRVLRERERERDLMNTNMIGFIWYIQISLRHCALNESSLIIGRAKLNMSLNVSISCIAEAEHEILRILSEHGFACPVPVLNEVGRDYSREELSNFASLNGQEKKRE